MLYADTGERMEWINMKLKENFITQDIYDSQYLVPIGGEAFNGMARSNETAAFIVDCLKKETTKEKIIDAVYNEYEASRDEISSDVDEILSKLRSINAIEE